MCLWVPPALRTQCTRYLYDLSSSMLHDRMGDLENLACGKRIPRQLGGGQVSSARRGAIAWHRRGWLFRAKDKGHGFCKVDAIGAHLALKGLKHGLLECLQAVGPQGCHLLEGAIPAHPLHLLPPRLFACAHTVYCLADGLKVPEPGVPQDPHIAACAFPAVDRLTVHAACTAIGTSRQGRNMLGQLHLYSVGCIVGLQSNQRILEEPNAADTRRYGH